MLTHHILCFFVILPPLVAHFQNLFISCPTDIARMDSDIARVRVCGVDTRRHLQTTKNSIKWSPLDSDFIFVAINSFHCYFEWNRKMNRRQGMILVESSSGEYDTLAKLHELAATDSESEGEGAVDYGLVESSSPSSGDDGSYHSDNDELAEYWDPYCKSPRRADRTVCELAIY